ncbi:MAG TPA: hypothetical protein VFI42_12965 [Thermomicrobiaceae bacterium]|nr:hypothetical protein [Thermomicrobiaceae bacterium]
MSDRPIGRPSDPTAANLYDAIVGRSREVAPETAPRLRSITMPTIAEMRKFRGDTSGNLGPRACILAGTETVLDGGQAIYVWDQSSVAKDDGVNVVQVKGVTTGRWRLAMALAPQHAALLQTTVVANTGSGTFASHANAVVARIRIWASGGGGGGAKATAGSPQVNVGSGATAGDYLEVWTTTIPANWAFTLGNRGTGGTNLGGNGNAGADATVSDGVTTYTAKGGTGGTGDAASGTGAHITPGAAQPAVATGGNLNGSAAAGGDGIHLGSTQAKSGDGGANSLGGGAQGRATDGVGANATTPGTGGAGALVLGGVTGRVGGDGAVGVICVEEFG